MLMNFRRETLDTHELRWLALVEKGREEEICGLQNWNTPKRERLFTLLITVTCIKLCSSTYVFTVSSSPLFCCPVTGNLIAWFLKRSVWLGAAVKRVSLPRWRSAMLLQFEISERENKKGANESAFHGLKTRHLLQNPHLYHFFQILFFHIRFKPYDFFF